MSMLCFFLCFLLAMSGIRLREETLAADIAPKLLRFHVLANSDSAADQALKLCVKDFLLERIRSETDGGDKTSLKTYIQKKASTLESETDQFIHKQGYDYRVKIRIETCRFPSKTYGDLTFPAGLYEAVRVIIGNGAGHNFWCVLYPSLCYTDSLHASMPKDSKETLKSLIPEDDYEALLRSGPQRSPSDKEASTKKNEQGTASLPTVKIRFRIAELFS